MVEVATLPDLLMNTGMRRIIGVGNVRKSLSEQLQRPGINTGEECLGSKVPP